MKNCTKCKEEKPLDSFHKNHKNTDGYHYHCKHCRKEESLKIYGLSLKEYDLLLEQQEGKCAICGTDDPKGQSKAGRFYVDHNHTTGEVRGLLCNDCNTGIGLLKDNPEVLLKAALYLTKKGHYGS